MVTESRLSTDILIEEARKKNSVILDLSRRDLTELPESIAHLSQLLVLYLNDNYLMRLPDSVVQLPQLEELYLNGNRLTTLPDSLAQLSQLKVLSLERNQLTTLPESVTGLSQLQRLSLSENQLSTLPESISQLSLLTTLYLDYNRLATLPESLRKLTQLRRLYLHGNEALSLPTEVLGPLWTSSPAKAAKPTAILDYYFRARGGEKRPLNEAKLILVGRGAVGKTSIVNRLVHGKFRVENKTEGIKITEWPLAVGKAKDEVRLNVWDFGGQEIMHATHQFFLTPTPNTGSSSSRASAATRRSSSSSTRLKSTRSM
jgi:internalin A